MLAQARKAIQSGRTATEEEYIRLAFELAYFIHPSRSIALCIVEEAWSKLEHALGGQRKRRRRQPDERQHDEVVSNVRPRTKIEFTDQHLLQLLVFAESDAWERFTENGDAPCALSDEDMIIRFVKHLVRISLKRTSFYAALAVGRLLYDYGTSEVRQMYDVLMQDDSRFRDNPYLRKQKRVLIREVTERFGGLIRVVRTPDREYRFEVQPTTHALIELVTRCLRIFTPWNTNCVIPERLDPLCRIPELTFSGGDRDRESLVEMTRFHTILHPDCFARLIAGLAFDSPHERLSLPRFFYAGNSPRGDRFRPPPLTHADYGQFRQTREERSRRRRAYVGRELRIFVDGVERFAFDPRERSRVRVDIKPSANVIELRGTDIAGELPLATRLVRFDYEPAEQPIEDYVLLEGGQKITITITPVRTSSGAIREARVNIGYAETRPIRKLSFLAASLWFRLQKRLKSGSAEGLRPEWARIATAAVIVVTLIFGVSMSVMLLRMALQPSLDLPVVRQVEMPPDLPKEVGRGSFPPPETGKPPIPETNPTLIAQAGWDPREDAITGAIRIEGRRGDAPVIDVSDSHATFLTAVPRVNAEGGVYHRYRITLLASGRSIWQQTLRTPRDNNVSRARVLELSISPSKLPKTDSCQVQFEGEAANGWQTLGNLVIKPNRK